MLITVEELRNISFRRANFGGYKPEDVDTFIDDMLVSYEEIIEKNKKLKEKVEELQSRIEKFHEEDNSIRNIILNAQKIAENSLNEAKTKTTEMVNKAKEEVSAQFQISEKLKIECSKLKKHDEEVYRKHMELINSIPSDAKEMNKSDSDKEISSGKMSEEQNILSQTKIYSGDESISGRIKNENIDNTKETFSFSSSGQAVNEKFKNLKFGRNIEDETGSYFGIFRKK